MSGLPQKYLIKIDLSSYICHTIVYSIPFYYRLWKDHYYRQTYNVSRTKFQNLNVFRLVLQLPPPNPLKRGFKSRMKM